MQKITPFLWFDNQAEEAMNFYLSVFKKAKAGKVVSQGKVGPRPEGSVLAALSACASAAVPPRGSVARLKDERAGRECA
jgi:predicted 3-demethylubiquinone-9 3-methyltransferase (glyoxalase superfamily)